METQSEFQLFNMARRGVVFELLLSKILFLVIFFKNLNIINGIELASSNGYVRREHSLTKPFQGEIIVFYMCLMVLKKIFTVI